MVPSAFDSSPPSSPSPQPFTSSPTTTQQRRTILVTMGPCMVASVGYRCSCPAGSCTPGLDARQAFCDICMHPMHMHGDYGQSPPNTSHHGDADSCLQLLPPHHTCCKPHHRDHEYSYAMMREPVHEHIRLRGSQRYWTRNGLSMSGVLRHRARPRWRRSFTTTSKIAETVLFFSLGGRRMMIISLQNVGPRAILRFNSTTFCATSTLSSSLMKRKTPMIT
jgi:hypothetical protein